MNKWNKAILGISLFMLGSFTICGSLTDKLISNFTKKTIDTTLSTKYAGCSVTGTEGALTTTTASSSDATSGIKNWYCHKIDGAWEVCPNSSGCTSYKLTGWLGYDKVKSFDKAGNESSETDLYTIVSETKEGTTKFKVSFAKNVGTNPLHIKDYEATVGEITDARIFKDANNNEKIKLRMEELNLLGSLLKLLLASLLIIIYLLVQIIFVNLVNQQKRMELGYVMLKTIDFRMKHVHVYWIRIATEFIPLIMQVVKDIIHFVVINMIVKLQLMTCLKL